MGYQPTASGPSNRGLAFSSIEVLTGGRATATVTANPPQPAPEKATTTKERFRGKAYLRFPHTTCPYDILETSTQALCGTMARGGILPTVFDQAAVDLHDENGTAVARLNCYVHSISACDLSPDAERVRVIVRFVDQDPAKLEALASLVG